jgi:hypothetical protein
LTGPRATLGIVLLAATTATACGGGSHFSDQTRPAVPVNVSVYIDNQRVSVSPSTISPGSVTLTITNQSSNAESTQVARADGSNAITTTGPISPGANDQVTVDLAAGQYSVAIAPADSTQAAAATPTGIMAGQLTVQGKRQNSNSQVLQP